MRKLLAWIDEQTGLITAVVGFMNEPLPEKVGWPHVFGSLVLFFFTVQLATGILLMAYYSPSPDHAYETVQYITYNLPFGWFVRGLHHWAASAMMICLGLHLLQVYVWGAYKRPRQIVWVIGIGLLIVTLGFSFTGYLLPWDQKAYWATVVGTNIAGSVPIIGGLIREIMRGGINVGAITLTRFFAIHVGILPPIITLLIMFHVLQVRKKGITPPWRRTDEDAEVICPQYFWPNQVLKDAIVALAALAIVAAVALKFGAPIEPLANPADTAYVPRPEWYFLWLFEMLKYFPGKWEFVGAVPVPSIGIALMAMYPYLDKNPERRMSMKKYSIALCVFTLAGVSYLGTRAMLSTPKPEKLTAVQKSGQKIFLDLRCQSCHGINGGGGNAGPDLAQSGPFKRDKLEVQLLDPTRLHPRSIMPPVQLSNAKMTMLISYLMAIKTTSRLPAEPQTGPKKPESHFEEQWYINHKFEVRKDPTQCGKCHEPEFCQTCHSKRRPDSHLNHWLKFHFGTARENPAYCRVCHKQSFCSSCHATMLHTPDWLKNKHAAAALKMPNMCANCHYKVMCDTCHKGNKPESHTANWITTHGKFAAAAKGECLACHRADTCEKCHGTEMPHPADWVAKHGTAALASPTTCARCHMGLVTPCQSCHTKDLKPAFHTADWAMTHKTRAHSQPELCRLCHAKTFCATCHGDKPPT